MGTSRFLLSAAVAIGVISGVSAASAADLPVKAPPPPPVVATWTGFYWGVNLGYSWGKSDDTSTITNIVGFPFFSNTNSTHLDGVIVGTQIGYNVQMANWVVGFEADVQGTGEQGDRSFTCGLGNCQQQITIVNTQSPVSAAATILLGSLVPVAMNQKIEWFGTFRGRAGMLVTPNVLVYGTGGVAGGGINTSEAVGVARFSFFDKSINYGWTAGVGVEGVIAPRWTAKLEYLYVDLGHVTGSFITPIPAPGGGPIVSNYNSHITDNILRVGVNYKFAQ